VQGGVLALTARHIVLLDDDPFVQT
jgi:hypothetical protein